MSKPRDTTPWRSVDGLLLLDKPSGLSSNQALQRARRLFLADKGGHTGSLDPLATGLLPLCFGEATKIAGFLLGSAKAYAAEVRLGVTTTTGDADGEILASAPVPQLDAARIEAALAPLRGRITQTPPVYSALKQDGEPLYARARRGEDVTAPAREVDVHRLDLVQFAGDRVRLEVECGSGTYVRSLAVDLGRALGCGAHLTALRRRWVEPFRAPLMHTLESLEAVRDGGGLSALDALLLPIDAGLQALPCVALDAAAAARFRQGQTLAAAAPGIGLCRVHGPGAHLLGLGEVDAHGRLTVRRGLNLAA